LISSTLSNELFSGSREEDEINHVQDNQEIVLMKILNEVIELSLKLNSIANIVDSNYPYDDKHQELSDENVVATVCLLKACSNVDKLLNSVRQFATSVDISDEYKPVVSEVESLCTFICSYLKVIAYYK
jgi:hypothetical protein